jgi:hypothetical protein
MIHLLHRKVNIKNLMKRMKQLPTLETQETPKIKEIFMQLLEQLMSKLDNNLMEPFLENYQLKKVI